MGSRADNAVGRWGEDLAVRYLTGAGWEILDRNWRCDEGELDVVARDGPTLVFCEVKTRTSTLFGDPAEAVGYEKSSRIRRLALRWLAEHAGGHGAELRFDVVSVVRPALTRPTVRHLRAAF